MLWFNVIILIALLFFLYLLIFRYKVPWVPIWQKDVERLDKLFTLEAGKVFYDLGCGNGRVIFYLAKKYPQVNFVGIELSLILYFFCRLRKIIGKYKNVNIKIGDYMRLDLNKADYIYVFANQGPMQEIGRKIAKEANKNLFLISYCFAVNDWQEYLLTQNKPGSKDNSIYIYQYKKSR